MLKNKLKSFSIDDIAFVETEYSDKYFEVEIWALASGNNSHKNPISEEVLERDKDSFKGAWVVADYDRFTRDATTHTAEEDIVGVVPFDSEIRTERGKDGRLWIVVRAVLSKVYHPEIWQMFKQHNFRFVSCEFRCAEGEEDENGNKPILGYDIVGITILGSGVNPSVEDAQMKVLKFSADEAIEYFNHNNNKLKQFMEDKKRQRQSNQRKDDVQEMSNPNTEDIVTFSEEPQVEDTVKKESTDVEFSEKETETKEEEKTEDVKDNTESMSEESEDEKKEDSEKDADTKKEMSEQCSDVIMSEDSDDDDKSDDDEKDEDEDKEDEPKKFSFDAYADNGALMALLEAETEENRDFAIGLFSEGNTAVFSKLMALKKENDTYKKNAEIEEKKNCDKTFAECMSEVKGEIDNETYDKLFAEGEAIQKMSDMTIFTQKVKAFAYDAKKVVGKDDGVFVVGAPVVTTDTKIDDTDVFARLASKYQ
jgi:hypothetical protein